MPTTTPTKSRKRKPLPNTTSNIIFVYGTLKEGFSNNFLLHQGRNPSALIDGNASTRERYPLIVLGGLPFMLDMDGVGHRVRGQVFDVTDYTLHLLDRLERHPSWYCRHMVPIRLSTGKQIRAWLYFRASRYDTTEEDLAGVTLQSEFTHADISRRE